jgi:hypothetical protein
MKDEELSAAVSILLCAIPIALLIPVLLGVDFVQRMFALRHKKSFDRISENW